MRTATLGLLVCGLAAAEEPPVAPPDVVFEPLSAGVWVATLRTNTLGVEMPANAVIFVTPAGPVLVDTGWRADQAVALVQFCVQVLGRAPILAVVTHAHWDRAGGLGVMIRLGIPVAMSALAAEKWGYRPRPGDVIFELSASLYGVNLFFPGEGHTADNIVAYHGASKTLAGGCFIRSEDGELGWADEEVLGGWPSSLRATAKRLPKLLQVVPGHGSAGGKELLEGTERLLR